MYDTYPKLVSMPVCHFVPNSIYCSFSSLTFPMSSWYPFDVYRLCRCKAMLSYWILSKAVYLWVPICVSAMWFLQHDEALKTSAVYCVRHLFYITFKSHCVLCVFLNMWVQKSFQTAVGINFFLSNTVPNPHYPAFPAILLCVCCVQK